MPKIKRYKEQSRVVLHQQQIIDFFLRNPNANDDQVHAIARDLGMTPEAFEGEIYHLLSSLLKGVGKHANVPDAAFDPKELEMGVKVEMEHTNNEDVAKIIAKDHLVEFPDYYQRLTRMEHDAKQDETVGLEIAVTKRLELAAKNDVVDALISQTGFQMLEMFLVETEVKAILKAQDIKPDFVEKERNLEQPSIQFKGRTSHFRVVINYEEDNNAVIGKCDLMLDGQSMLEKPIVYRTRFAIVR